MIVYRGRIARKHTLKWLDLDEALTEYHEDNFREMAECYRIAPTYHKDGHRIIVEDMVLRGFHEVAVGSL